MIAILAILHESWLSLRARGIFKITMGLNVLVIVLFMSVSFSDTGVNVFFGLGHIEHEYVNLHTPWARVVYLSIFTTFIVNLWLAWIAAGLALLSTSSIVPDFLSQGAVELTLSRPVSRTTIFLCKYAGGLLFVIVQVSVFSLGAFIAAGWRIGVWDPALFLAVPLVTLFYSYLFCVNVLAGVITRSTLTALIITLAFWFVIFAVRWSERIVTEVTFQEEVHIERLEKKIAGADENSPKIEDWTLRLEQSKEMRLTLQAWQGPLETARVFLPETAATVDLLKRAVDQSQPATIEDIMSGRLFETDEDERRPHEIAQERREERDRNISGWWIVLKSLIFEAVILSLAVWIFRRRDY
ncbi:MAG: ABC transporter permease subunit [Phycisphaerales bacterium]|nr:ABC transporter permease subunit [Phycisphaerales bacterium]